MINSPTPTPERNKACCEKCDRSEDRRTPKCANFDCPCHHISAEPSKVEKELIPEKSPKINTPTPESRLREDELKREFDAWYRSQKEMNPYIMRDWFLSKLSQEREALVGEINKMWVFRTKNKAVDMIALDGLISKAAVLALLKSKN